MNIKKRMIKSAKDINKNPMFEDKINIKLSEDDLKSKLFEAGENIEADDFIQDDPVTKDSIFLTKETCLTLLEIGAIKKDVVPEGYIEKEENTKTEEKKTTTKKKVEKKVEKKKITTKKKVEKKVEKKKTTTKKKVEKKTTTKKKVEKKTTTKANKKTATKKTVVKKEEKKETPKKDVKVNTKVKSNLGNSKYSNTIEMMCKNPDMTKEQLISKMVKKYPEADNTTATITTAYSTVRRIVKALRANGKMD